MDEVHPFEFSYSPADVRFGRGSIEELESTLAALGVDRALVVCGSNVAANRALMGPIEAGAGDRLAGTFDGTTPAKGFHEAAAAVARMRGDGVDGLIAVGGGSSLDVARATNLVQATGLDVEEVRAEATDAGGLAVPDGGLVPLVVVPTTLAGADLSTVGSVSVSGGGSAGYSDPSLMPDAAIYDPSLFETTPPDVLAGSAMNGFDKGLESVYSRHATPITDATATHGLRLLSDALPSLLVGEGDDRAVTTDEAVVDRVVAGTILVQYGLASAGPTRLNVVHAFGHGLRRVAGVQQGLAHAVVVPHVLRDLFETVDGGRALLADALGVRDDRDPATGVVDAVTAVRDGLGLPARLRALDGIREDDLTEVARVTHEDSFIAGGPEGYEPDRDRLERVLRAAW